MPRILRRNTLPPVTEPRERFVACQMATMRLRAIIARGAMTRHYKIKIKGQHYIETHATVEALPPPLRRWWNDFSDLLEAGADPNARSRLGSTALGQAELADQAELVHLLEAAGAIRVGGADLAALMEPSELDAIAPAAYRVRFATTSGVFVVAVERRLAPHAADRFFNLVRHGFFDTQRFFRVVRGRLVQFGLHGTPEVAARWYQGAWRP